MVTDSDTVKTELLVSETLQKPQIGRSLRFVWVLTITCFWWGILFIVNKRLTKAL